MPQSFWILVSRELPDQKYPKYFFFEKQWLLKPDFHAMVAGKWEISQLRRPEGCYSILAGEPGFPKTTS